MALPESAFQKPYWIRLKYEATLSRNDRARFHQMSGAYSDRREFRAEPQPGFNAQSPSIKADRFNLETDAPYIRAK